MSGGHGDALSFAVYLGFLGYLVARLARRRTASAEGYFLAGRALSLPAFVATLVASWYGGILGVGEYGYLYGISSWLVFGVPYYLAALLFALVVARRARTSPYVSIPDAIRHTYGEVPARIAGAIVFVMTAPASYVLMIGTLLAFAFGWPREVAIGAGTVLSLAYVVRGGLHAVVRTDLLQCALMFAGFACAVAYLVSVEGFAPLRGGVPETHWTWHGGNSPQYVLVWFFIALATLIEPAFYQRVFAARSPAVARKGIFVSVGFWISFDALTATTALYARALLPAGTDPVLAFPLLSTEVLPAALGALLFVGMVAAIMSTVDTNGSIAPTTPATLLARRGDETTDAARARARWGILGTGIVSAAIAMASSSVVDIWHGLGSVGTPALLLPVLACFAGRPVSPGHGAKTSAAFAAAWIVVPGALSALWLAMGTDGAPWLGVEPIYAGLAASLVMIVVRRLRFGSG